MRGNRFKTKDDLKEAVTNSLNEKPSDFYEEAFLELARRRKMRRGRLVICKKIESTLNVVHCQ